MADRFPLIIDNSEEKIKELVSGDNLDLTKSNLKNADHIQSAGVNVAGVATATSLIGDGSQLTNLPPSGGSLTATASGTLSDGSKVIINTDGTVSVVAQTETTGPGFGSPVVFNSTTTSSISSVYDSSNQKVVIAYRDGTNGYGTAIVGTVSGTSITFGSPTTFESASTTYISATFDSTNNKVVIAYRDGGNSNYGTAIVGTVSGTSISFGTPTVFESATIQYTSVTYDSTNGKVVITYRDNGNNYYGTAVVGTVSGTSISFGSPVVFKSNGVDSISAIYDSTNNKVIIAYQDWENNNYYGTAIVGTVSGTSISFGTPVEFASNGNTNNISATYDSTNNKVVIAYRDSANSEYGTAIVGEVSGTSISFGSAVVFESANSYQISATYDSANQKVVIVYNDYPNSEYGTSIVGTVSGNSISFGSPVVFNSAGTLYISAVYDSNAQKVVIAYGDQGNSSYGKAVVYGNTGFPAPQLGSPEVFESATTYYTSATYDSSNQKVVISYRDNGNSNYGTAVVGTVSGTSISFGTPVVFSSSSIDYNSPIYDSANNKIVIAYRDTGNSSYGRAVVGEVSGTSISFGSPTTFRSSNSSYISAVYDSTNQKVVIAYQAGANSDRGTAVVGTVSGTSISFGGDTIFEYGAVNFISSTFDSSNGKVVIAYQDAGNSNYGTAVVGTVSGTSISFGSAVVFESADTAQTALTYDSANGKVVIVYRDRANSDYGTAIVGTVSGTSISFGSAVVYNPSSSYPMTVTYDSSDQKIVISYLEASSTGKVIVGTVSGTSISFGTPVAYPSGQPWEPSATFDSTNNKVVIAYRDGVNSQYGTAVTFSPRTISTNLTSENYIGISNGAYSNGQTATIQIMGAVDDAQSSLTPGQKYYVQDDGTLAESGSVFAGTAIAATKLIVRG